MNLHSYLTKRPGSSNWQLRWMVPVVARAAVGRTEFTKSLGTDDRRQAEARAYSILAEWRSIVDEALRKIDDQPKRLTEAPVSEEVFDNHLADYHDLQTRIRRVLVRETATDTASLEVERAGLQTMIASLQSKLFLDKGDDYLNIHTALLRDAGYVMPDDESVRKAFTHKAIRTLIDSLRRVDAEISGDDFKPSAFIINAKRRLEARVKRQSIADLFEAYASQRLREGAKRKDSIEQDRVIMGRFLSFVGTDRAIDSITKSDIREWRDTSALLPRNYNNIARYKDLNMREAAQRAVSDGATPISAVTLNKYLSTISPFFRWAVQSGYTETNPCDGLFLSADKSANPYPTFSAQELTTIIKSPLFTGFARTGKEYKPGKEVSDDWRKWIPLLCLFTGSRIGEIAQLHIDDVRFEHGRYFLSIKNDASTGQRTKSGKSRIVPIHHTLEQAGFIRFVERRRSEGRASALLFAELSPNARDHIGAAPSRFWRTYLARIGIKDGGDGRGSHSFRHTLADELRAAGFLDDQFGPLILGHHKANVTAGYGRLPQGTADMLCAMIDGVRFEGVDFSALVGAAA